jgi:transposase
MGAVLEFTDCELAATLHALVDARADLTSRIAFADKFAPGAGLDLRSERVAREAVIGRILAALNGRAFSSVPGGAVAA